MASRRRLGQSTFQPALAAIASALHQHVVDESGTTGEGIGGSGSQIGGSGSQIGGSGSQVGSGGGAE